MSYYRGNQNTSATWIKQEPTSGLSSPRSILVANGIDASNLHDSPTALTVSPSGERSICSLDNFNNSIGFKDTNPFFNSNKEQVGNESEPDGNPASKFISKKEKNRHQYRRKLQARERLRPEKCTITTKRFIKPKQPKCAWVQTDASLGSLEFIPECIGDAEMIRQSQLVSSMKLKGSAVKAVSSIDHFFAQYLSESLKMFTSYLLMIFLIFTITSLVLDVDIFLELYRIASYYLLSFQWGYYQKEEPQSFFEKCWSYIKDKFE